MADTGRLGKVRVKKTSMALTAGVLLGSLLLGGCASDTPAGEPKPSGSASPSPTATATVAAVVPAMPEARGIEATPVIVDPSMANLHPEAAAEVQEALTAFLNASRSFPELEKGSRPALPEHIAILEPVMRPLMTDSPWADSLAKFQDGNPVTLPDWYIGGNPFDSQDDANGNPLDEASRDTFTPDENGHTYVHAQKQPITIAAVTREDGVPSVQVRDIQYRAFFRNIQGSIGAMEKTATYTFVQNADDNWLFDYWNNKDGYGWATTEEHIDALMDF